MTPIEQELATYARNDVTTRLVQALLGVLPTAMPHRPWQDLDAAAEATFPGATGLVAPAREALASPPLATALALAKTVDDADRGVSLLSGLGAAWSLLLGAPPATAFDDAQREDAALKGLALLVACETLVPGVDAEHRWRALQALPAGNALLHWFGAIEVAMPFAGNPPQADVVATLFAKYGEGAQKRLSPVVGGGAVAAALAVLPVALPALEAVAAEGSSRVDTLLSTAQGYLPARVVGVSGAVGDLVAKAVDALPCWRLLLPRLAVEAALLRAREASDPTFVLVAPVVRQAQVDPPPPPPFLGKVRSVVPGAPDPDDPQE